MKKHQKLLILQTEGKNRVRQWHFSFRSIIAFICIVLCFLGSILFFTADSITEIFYNLKLNKIRSEYSNLSTTLNELNSELTLLNTKIEVLEKQDEELRKFSGLPIIDSDIREVGIGGARIKDSFDFTYFSEKMDPEVYNLENNIDALKRKVKLELNSFNEIHQKILENKEKLKHIPSIRPVIEGYLNSGYGYRKDPIDGIRRFHDGQDFSVYSGALIKSPANGIVKRTGYRGGYGKYIIIDHGFGFETKYLHLSKIKVKKGQSVERGELIGETGNTGRSTAPHLHYEVILNGTPQNPLNYFFNG